MAGRHAERWSPAPSPAAAHHRSPASGGGRHVVFTSNCKCVLPEGNSGHGDVFVRDVKKGTTRIVSVATDGTQGDELSQTAEISANGRYVVFASFATNLVPGDTNGRLDVFVASLKS